MTRPIPWLQAARGVFDLAFGGLLWSRRSAFLVLAALVPVGFGAAVRLIEASGTSVLRVNGEEAGGVAIFGLLIWGLYVRLLVPLLGVFHGTALIADEVEHRTLTYLFTRPVHRSAVLVGKYAAYLACTGLLLLPSLMLTFFLLVPTSAIGLHFGALVRDLGIVVLGLASYGAVFALAGTWLRRPLISGLSFAFGWEPVVMAMPGMFRSWSVGYYLQSLVPHAAPSDTALSLLTGMFAAPIGPGEALGWLGLITGGSLLAAAVVVTRREYVLDQ